MDLCPKEIQLFSPKLERFVLPKFSKFRQRAELPRISRKSHSKFRERAEFFMFVEIVNSNLKKFYSFSTCLTIWLVLQTIQWLLCYTRIRVGLLPTGLPRLVYLLCLFKEVTSKINLYIHQPNVGYKLCFSNMTINGRRKKTEL